MRSEPIQLVIVGPSDDPETVRMLGLIRRMFLPRAAALHKPTGDSHACARLADLAPFTEFMEPIDGRATAYICHGHSCDAPDVGVEALEEALNRYI